MTTCNKAVISNIQRFSLDDGPGIRTTIFLKGCNLSCRWCHNPECINDKIEVEFFNAKCKACGRCSQACTACAKIDNTGKINRELCISCGECIDACRYGALELVGETRSVEELIDIVKRDAPYYNESGGGVTISGGEPMLQIEFLAEMLSACKEKGFHTAVDTAGCVPPGYFKRIAKDVDLFLFDIKMLDSNKHKEYTGVDNEIILSNLKYLNTLGNNIFVRIPCIKGINDDLEEMSRIAEIISCLGNVKSVKVLPYHSYGEGKYQALDKEYGVSPDAVPEKDFIEQAKALFTSRGIELE